MMPLIKITQIKDPGPVSERGMQDREREVISRTTGFQNNHEVMFMVSIIHFSGRLFSAQRHSRIKNIFREEKEREGDF